VTIDDALAELNMTKNVRFTRLVTIATAFFGEPRIHGSHHFFRTPWEGQPLVNLQPDGKGAKPYQVKQVVKALDKLKGGGS
jgi:hypothetical protein